MASKGIIHRNAAGRYKSRLTTPHRRKSCSGLSTGAARIPRPLPRAQFDDQPLEQHARIAGRSLQVQIGAEQRVDGGWSVAGGDGREFRPHQPAELAEDLFRRRRRRRASAPAAERLARLPGFDRVRHRPVVLERRRPDDLAHVVDA